MISAFFCLLAVVYYIFFYLRTKDALHPIAVFLVVWCLAAAFSALFLSPLQGRWNLEMVLVVFISSVAVFLAGHIGDNFAKKSIPLPKITLTNTYWILSRVLVLFCLFCAFLEWRASGYLLPLFLPDNVGDKKNIIVALKGIHYGTVLFPYCSIFCFYEMLFIKRRHWTSLFFDMSIIAVVLFHSYAVILSRGVLISILLAFLYILHKRHPISIKLLCGSMIILIVGFAALAMQRIGEGSLVFTAVEGLPSQFNAIYTYVAFNFENLFKLVEAGSPYTIFQYTFLPIYHIFGLRSSMELINYNTLFFNARTYLYGFYHDLGMIGVALFPFLISFLISIFYRKSRTDSRYILLLAVLQKPIVMAFFGNYFSGEFIIIWPYLVIGLLMFTLSFNIKFNASCYSLKRSAGLYEGKYGTISYDRGKFKSQDVNGKDFQHS